MNKKNIVLIVILAICLSACASTKNRARKERERDPKYNYNLGLLYLNQNNINLAIKSFVKCLTLDTSYYLAWNGIGLAHLMEGNLNESVKAFEKCLEINPQFAEGHNYLGIAYQQLNQMDKAELEYKKAVADPTYTKKELPYCNLARLYIIQDKLNEAYQFAQKAIIIQPRWAMAHHLQGTILERWNKLPEAIAAYEQAVKIVPDDVTYNYSLAAAYFKNGDVSMARTKFLQILPRITDTDMKLQASEYIRLAEATN